MSYTDLPEDRILVKVQGANYQEALFELKKIAHDLQESEPNVLTIQFVPENFVEP